MRNDKFVKWVLRSTSQFFIDTLRAKHSKYSSGDSCVGSNSGIIIPKSLFNLWDNVGFITISSSCNTMRYGDVIDSIRSFTGTKIMGDENTCDESSRSFHFSIPKVRYKVVIPCSSIDVFALYLRDFSVFWRSLIGLLVSTSPFMIVSYISSPSSSTCTPLAYGNTISCSLIITSHNFSKEGIVIFTLLRLPSRKLINLFLLPKSSSCFFQISIRLCNLCPIM